jgi:hypothetical protein
MEASSCALEFVVQEFAVDTVFEVTSYVHLDVDEAAQVKTVKHLAVVCCLQLTNLIFLVKISRLLTQIFASRTSPIPLEYSNS